MMSSGGGTATATSTSTSLSATGTGSRSAHRRQSSSSTTSTTTRRVNPSPPVPRRPPLTSTSSATSTNSSDLVHQGWLTKSPPTRSIFKQVQRWRRRWFILKAGLFPNQFVLEYFTDDTCRRHKGSINLDECEQISAPLSIQDRHKYTFNLRTPSRTYYLASDSEAEMTKWVTCLCQVCGLKTTEVETEMYTKPSDENNQPQESEEQHDNLVSDESSPTLSSASSAYIPISECFTGKPILFNDKTYGKETIYCNTTSFPFPPKVNWATHPAKKEPSTEQSSTVATPSPNSSAVVNSVNAPPRPPKKVGSAGVPGIAITVPETETSESNSTKQQHTPSSGPRDIFRYDETFVEENHDDSSTCSSLQSPPSSAGALYCNLGNMTSSSEAKGGNISPTGPIYQNPSAMLLPTSQSSQMNPIPSPAEPTSATSATSASPSTSATPPPKVNRKLKPDVNKPLLSPSPNKFPPCKHSSGAMTLPSRNNFRQMSLAVGPVIDRTRKPPESPLLLGPTPAQVKNQVSSSTSASRHHSQGGSNSTSTLPASPRRRAGPIISPHDHRLPVYHEYDQPDDLRGTYLQIDCKASSTAIENSPGESTKSHNSKVNLHKKPVVPAQKEEGSVEYRLIDHVKTKALNQMRQEREEQLVRTNPISLKSFN